MLAPSSAAMTKRPTKEPSEGPDSQRAERLKRVRSLLKYPTQKTFADALGIIPSRWSNFEAGAPLSIEIAQKLVRLVPGLTLDWLYNGERRGLSVELDRRLHEAESKDRARRA
jgi:transcriptional regulator with XRE-family HTH domain